MDFIHPSRETLIWLYVKMCAHVVLLLTAGLFLMQVNGYPMSTWFNKHPIICTLVSILVAASIILFVGSRNYYLPFLGSTVYPCGSLAEKVPTNADTSITVQVPAGANVVYWASEPSDPSVQPISNPWDAYALYDNSGVVRADASGNAVLRVRSPSSYKVGYLYNRELKRHIHYRVCSNAGLMSPIRTVYV